MASDPGSERAVVGEWDREPAAVPETAQGDAGETDAAAWPEFLRDISPSLATPLLGTVDARIPGQLATEARVSFGRVRVTAKLEGGFAYTEVEEELVNDVGAQIEAIVSFRAPPGGVIARMGLWVDDRWVEAEVVERQRAAEVYRGIVERRRDPALLEQDPSGFLKLRVFPVPGHGSRRVVVGYVQPLERRKNRYHFELGLRLAEGVLPIRELSTEVELLGIGAEELLFTDEASAIVEPSATGTRVRWAGSRIRPRDARVSFAAPAEPLTTFVPAKAKGRERFVALRVTPDLPSLAPERDASVWLIDTSVGQGGPALDVTKALLASLIKQLPAGERFAILACDTACSSYPRRGLARATSDARGAAQTFVAGLEARGASDIGYALFEALQRTQGQARAQLVYFGDARPTAGDLHADEMLARLAARAELLDVRLVGVGRALESASLSEFAASVGAARTTIGGGPQEAERMAMWLEQPILRSPSLALPSGFESAYPRHLPNIVRGDEELVLARLGRRPSTALSGDLRGRFDNGVSLEARRSELGLQLPQRDFQADSVPRLWARARLRELDNDEAPAAYSESVELSKRYQVLSRHTSFLALESDAMFRGFGIEQRFGRADFGPAPLLAPPQATRPRTAAPHRVRAPTIHTGATTISGRVPAETIQETVRRSDGLFRACYHEGLLRNPKLEGTVTTRFLIGRDGTVVNSTDSGSTLADRAVVACVVRAFKTLVFPTPDDPVTVVYPFALSPSTQGEPRRLPTPWLPRRRSPFAMTRPPLAELEPPQRVSATVLAAQVEQEPTNVELQLAAAEAYEAERNERRACAHFRAAATLAPSDLDAQYQALRCRARSLGERVSALADIGRLELHSPAIDDLALRLRTLAEIPAFSAPAP